MLRDQFYLSQETLPMEQSVVRIDSLHPHPRQSEFFMDLSTVELAELAEEIASAGLLTPITVTSDGTIICGHQRVAAARLLGWEDIDAYVLDDDEALNADDLLISDNVVGRQLDPLTLARCYREQSSRYDTHYEDEKGDMRDVLAVKLRCGKSGRSLDRLKRLLDLPRDIQDMISRRELAQSHGEFLLKLDETTRNAAISRIRDGEKPAQVIKSLKPASNDAAHRTAPATVLSDLLDHCNKLKNSPTEFVAVQFKGRDIDLELEAAIDTLIALRDRKRELRHESLQQISRQLP